jgi:abequosyltransferase
MALAFDISIVVPAYNRPNELSDLFLSVLSQSVLPREVVVVEDCSPMRESIRGVCGKFFPLFERAGCSLVYIENNENIGFDRNLRKCLSVPSGSWALLLGNDDVLLPNAVEEVVKYVSKHDVFVASRSFVRFVDDVAKPLGVSRISNRDMIFRAGESSSNMIFRSGAFIGGLLFDVDFCRLNETEDYDGTLYYQIYLFSLAFCSKGIGYISTPIAAGRAGNPPMFGASDSEKGVHVPGAYTASGRAKMWRGVLNIVTDVQKKYDLNLISDIKHELMVRQSFHIFEMNSNAGCRANWNLARELSRLGLFWHALPMSLFSLNVLTGRYSSLFYRAARRFIQNR